MKENVTMSTHLSQFHVILKNLVSQGINFTDEVTPLFFLGILSESWDVFRIALCASATTLKLRDVESALLQEEINCKNLDASRVSHPFTIRDRDGNGKNDHGNGRGAETPRSLGL